MRCEFRRPARLTAIGIAISIGLTLCVGVSARPASATGSCGSTSPRDQVQASGDESGIGGTGVGESQPDRPDLSIASSASGASGDDSESGIGGTGIFGTVMQLNRLCVNGLEIRLPQQLQGRHQETQQHFGADGGFDGQRLAVGQLVWIRAMESEDGLVATAIEIHPGLAGEIKQVMANGRRLMIREQVVQLSSDTELGAGLQANTFAVGQSVVVHGLRDDQNHLIASRIEFDTERKHADNRAQPAAPPGQWIAKRLGRNDAPRSVSIEGYVREDAAHLFLTGMRVELAPSLPRPEMQTLRPGRHIMVEGRILRGGVLRIDRSQSRDGPGQPATTDRQPPRIPKSGSGEPPQIERSPEAPTPSTAGPKASKTHSKRPRDVRDRGHLSPKPRPHRIDRLERRPSPTAERPPTLDRFRR